MTSIKDADENPGLAPFPRLRMCVSLGGIAGRGQRMRSQQVLVIAIAAVSLVTQGHRCGGTGGNTLPTAPVLGNFNVRSNSISGTISPCTDDGLPAGSSCINEIGLAIGGYGPVVVPGSTWTIPGLSQGVEYQVYARACDPQGCTYTGPIAITTNTPPLAPSITVTGVAPTSMSGVITSCQDDGQPNYPCTRQVVAMRNTQVTAGSPPPNGTCTNSGGQCNCASVDPNEAGRSSLISQPSTNWTWTQNISSNAPYTLYGVVSDGEFSACSAGVEAMTPFSVQGCHKWDAGRVYVVPEKDFNGSNGNHAVRTHWAPRPGYAPDHVSESGYSLTALIVSLNNTTPPSQDPTGMPPYNMYKAGPNQGGGSFVEVGAADIGFSTPSGWVRGNALYFTVRATPSGMLFQNYFPDSNNQPAGFSGTATKEFMAGSCAFLPGTWCAGKPATTAFACIDEPIAGRCRTFDNMGTSEVRFFSVGVESTCGSNVSAVVQKQKMTNTQVRWGNNWLNLTSANFGGITAPFRVMREGKADKPVNPGPSTLMDAQVCTLDSTMGWIRDTQTVNCP